jgi:hypothetical protein
MWLQDAKAIPIQSVVAAYTASVKRNRFGPCPACRAERVSRHDRRYPCLMRDRWQCVACKAWGDGLDLIAYSLTGASSMNATHHLDPVRDWFAAQGWCRGTGAVVQFPLRAASPPPPPKTIPADELRAWLSKATPIAKSQHVGVQRFLANRGYNAAIIPAAVAPRDQPDWWRWGQAYPIIVTAWHPDGTLAAVHGRSTLDPAPSGRKTRWPYDCDCMGLLFADPWRGRPMLRGQAASVRKVLIAEGLTDFLDACQMVRHLPEWAVLGGTSGSFQALGRVPFPGEAVIYSAVDEDQNGERYHSTILASVKNEVKRTWSIEHIHNHRYTRQSYCDRMCV